MITVGTSPAGGLPVIRQSLRDEMHAALDAALNADDPYTREFYAGLHAGYGIAFGIVTRAILDWARMVPFSKNVHIDFWTPHAFADHDTFLANGVRHGYYLGSSEFDDAYECELCGERLTHADAADVCLCGRFCELDGCADVFHRSGPSLCRMEGPDE